MPPLVEQMRVRLLEWNKSLGTIKYRNRERRLLVGVSGNSTAAGPKLFRRANKFSPFIRVNNTRGAIRLKYFEASVHLQMIIVVSSRVTTAVN
jgi:hypothetical protein